MKHLNTGMYSFGDSLGKEIIRQNIEADAFDLSVYMARKQRAHFGPGVGHVNHRKFHKIFFPFRRKFDLVHFTDQCCRLPAQRVGGRKILTIHDMNQVHEFKGDGKKIDAYLGKLKSRIDACDRIVTISNFVAANIAEHFPDTIGKLSVIYNGSEHFKAPQQHRPRHVPDAQFLFTIGMLCPKKNFHVLVPLLQNNHRQLLIAGIVTPDYQQKILAEAKKFGVSERVIITGTISEDDKNWYYQHCEAFVFPSLAEGFGLPVIEAMGHGKPVFLSRLTSLPEIGGDAAYYFDHFEPEHMQGVFQNGMHHFATRDGVRAVLRNAGKYSWEQAAKSYLDLYRDCLQAG